MKPWVRILKLSAVLPLSFLLTLVLILPAAQAQLGPGSFKDVIRGDGAKVWMTKEVVPKKKYVVAVALPNMPDPTWQSVWYGCMAQAQKLGLESRIADAGGYNRLDVQVSQLENFIQLKVDGIIIGAVQGDGVVPVLQRASDAGIKIVDTFLYENSGRASGRVINDQREIGAAEANYLGKALGGKGNVVLLYGGLGNTTMLSRGEGFKEALKKQFPEMKVLAEKFSDINRAEGLRLMEDLLQAFPGQINGVYTGGSFLADGAADAVAAKRAGKILIATASPNPGTIDRIKRGEIHMMADQQNVMQGRITMNIMVSVLNGDKVPELIVPPIRELTAENIGTVEWSLSLPPAGWKP
jgi:ABC-type sugar transport system substrate-binding protein